MTRRKQGMGDDPLAWLDGVELVADGAGVIKAMATEAEVVKGESSFNSHEESEATATISPAPIAVDSRLVLQVVMDITMAEALKGDLGRLLASDLSAVEIDGSAVEKIDTSIMQLLAVFMQAMTAAGRRVSWAFASDTLRSSAQLLGLADRLSLSA